MKDPVSNGSTPVTIFGKDDGAFDILDVPLIARAAVQESEDGAS